MSSYKSSALPKIRYGKLSTRGSVFAVQSLSASASMMKVDPSSSGVSNPSARSLLRSLGSRHCAEKCSSVDLLNGLRTPTRTQSKPLPVHSEQSSNTELNAFAMDFVPDHGNCETGSQYVT